MNVQEKINKMENCRGKNHDLLEFRQWLTDAKSHSFKKDSGSRYKWKG